LRILFLLASALLLFGQQGSIRVNPAASLNSPFIPIITTLAGTDWQYPTGSLPAVNAPLGQTAGVAADANGNVYVADSSNNIVARVGADGIATVVAGNSIAGFSGDGGFATGASLNSPSGVAVDSVGNIYIADKQNSRVRRVSRDGTITTIAGDGNYGFSGDGGAATSASLSQPTGVAVDSAGNIYIADDQNSRIRRISPDGTITTVVYGSIYAPQGVAVDSAGNLYVADFHCQIWKASGSTITTVAGNGNCSFSGDGGPATSASLYQPEGVAVDSADNLYIADSGNHRIRKVSGGTITTVAGNGNQGFSGDGGPATLASLDYPSGVGVDGAGSLYIADSVNHRIRKVSGGTITTVAGDGAYRFSGDGGPATSASLNLPRLGLPSCGLALDGVGDLYIADIDNFRIRKVSGGTITTVAGVGNFGFPGGGGVASSTSFSLPVGVAADAAGNLYIADAVNERIWKVSGGTISAVAGNGISGFSGDGGPATSASLFQPYGVAVDSLGNLYIADEINNRIRKVSGGMITTVAGNGSYGFSGDGGPATSASLRAPTGVAVDAAGNLYIADIENNRIRKVSGGKITTVAGDGNIGFSGDGGPATSASLTPIGVAVDAAGNLYIADIANNRIRKVSGGIITTVAGDGNIGFSGDGGPATGASLDHPAGIAVDSVGNLYIADMYNNRIRQVLANPPVSTSPLISSQLSLSASSGGKPASATINAEATVAGIGSTLIPGMAFTAQVNGGNSWLSLYPQSGATPGLITATADPLTLRPGTYQGTITLSLPYANPSTQTVNVQFTVGAAVAPNLAIDHTHLSFTYSNTSVARTQTITVSNAGGGQLPFSASVALNSGQLADWLTVTPSSGMATPAAPAVLTVRADPTRLPPGAYTGQIALTSATGSATVTVTMTITSNPLVLLLSQTGLTFTVVQNGGAIPPQAFSVLNLGSGTLNWSSQTSVLGGINNWLAATPNSGSTRTASSSGAPVITVRVNPVGLQPGVYYGLVTVTSPVAANTPQAVVVVLQVLPARTDVAPIVQPNSLIFTGPAGDSSPGSQTVQVYDPTGTSKSFRSGIALGNGWNWLVTLPTDATIPANQPVQMVVEPLVNNLTPGIYSGTLTLQFSDGRVSTVGIQFIVTGSSTALTEARTEGRAKPLDASGVCTPTQLLPFLLTLGTGFSLPAGYPQGLEAQVVDDCGAPQVDGTVFVQFNDGEAPVKLQSLGNGIWDGTWPVSTQATSQMTLTVTAKNPAAIAGESQINGALGSAAPPPVVMDQGVLSSAALAPSVETPLAPGGLISIYGQQLSDGQSSVPANVALPGILAGTTVLIGSQAASAVGQFQSMPMSFASSGQVNAQVPFEVNVNTNQQLILQRDYTYATPVYVDVAAAQPGIFQSNQQAVIYDLNNNLIGPGNPAHVGDTIVIYCAGLGSVNSQPADGAVTPDASSTVVNPVNVSIGPSNATASSAGLLPGMIGVYQVTVTVPQGTPPGDGVQVSLMVAGQVSPAVNLSVR
jgi:uncharacterized protein (TIGR03437 family)